METEFGCLVREGSYSSEAAVSLVKDAAFYDLKFGALDIHARDEVFEPAASGGFLTNGGRLYIDAVGSHLEYATAECRRLDDLVAHDKAGHRLVSAAVRQTGLSDEVDFYNNSVDHFGGHTFGCHENYLVKMSEDFFAVDVELLYAFLVTRQIFAGAGRVGGHILAEAGRPDYQEMADNPIDYIWVSQVYQVFEDDSVDYQVSQRADHIIRTVASRVRFNRALVNPKWEHFYAHEGMHRLHLLFGEANQSTYAYKLKVGTTCLVLSLLEDGDLAHTDILASPLVALREVSRDGTYKWRTLLEGGEETSALDIQYRLLEKAQRYAGLTPDIDWTLREWARTLDGLRSDPLSMGDRLDWVAKKQVLEAYVHDAGVGWEDDSLHSIDLEYHNIDESKSLFGALVDSGSMVSEIDELDVIEAMAEAPDNTRAKGRSIMVRKAIATGRLEPYVIDWSGVVLGRRHAVEMPDPFETYEAAANGK